ncbi:MAG: hypothetical protein IT442_16340 [Phycisphaeraceae bacterium]|nr:hypothetical protein [Phycisphaeraceae bacterium]
MWYLIIIAAILFWPAVTTLIARLEKRLVWPYGELADAPEFPDTTGYCDRWIADAAAESFSPRGWASDLKGPRYPISYAMLGSRDGTCLAIIASGSVYHIPVRGTWLYTATRDGRLYYSTDNQICVEVDIMGEWKSHLVPTSSFQTLLQRHREWVEGLGVMPMKLQPMHEIEAMRNNRQEHFRAMSRLGLIRFTDASETRWQYTMRGAIKLAMLNYSVGLIRAVTFGRIPRSA